MTMFDMWVLESVMRPQLTSTLIRMGWDWVLVFARSGDRWRQGRRVLDRGLRLAAMPTYRPMIQAKTLIFLSRLLENPKQWEDDIDLSVWSPFDSHDLPEIYGKRSAF